MESIVTYGVEVWETTGHMRKRLHALEMRYWKRCCRLTLLDRVKSEEIRERTNVCTNINDTIDVKILGWYEHVCRMV